MEKVVVTGGSGFIGTNLIDLLVSKNIAVLNVDTLPPAKQDHYSFFKKCSILEEERLFDIIHEFQPTHVIHLAARTDLEGNSLEDYAVNTTGTENVIKVAQKVKSIRKVVFASSMLVCALGYQPKYEEDYHPTTVYGRSKVESEIIVRTNRERMQFDWVIVRPTSIWGPWFKQPYRNFFDMIQKRTYLDLGEKACTKTYGYVENTTFQIYELLRSAQSNGKTFYLGDEPPINISVWANEISDVTGLATPPKIHFILFKCAALFGDLLTFLNIGFPVTSFRLKNMTTDNILDLEETYAVCGVPPYSRIEGIRKTIAWLDNSKK